MKKRKSQESQFSGVLLIDKQAGITSFGVVEEVRRLLGVQRVGHCGTLDPMATGLLVILLGEATKAAQFLTDEEKSYSGTIQLGQQTDTDDAEGQVIASADCQSVTLEQIKAAGLKMLGQQVQTPPRFSAQKRQGVRAYERARNGEDFEPEARTVWVHELDFAALQAPGLLSFSCRVGKGTYVRSLARDLGLALGVFGHVAALRRTFSGLFSLENALTLTQLEALPLQARIARIQTLPQAWRPRAVAQVGAEDIVRIRKGQKAAVSKEALLVAPSTTGPATVLVIDAAQLPIAIGQMIWDRATHHYVFSPERNFTFPAALSAGHTPSEHHDS